MSSRIHLDYLNDIWDSIHKIEAFTKKIEEKTFYHDSKTNYAVVRALEIIGEATKQIPHSYRQQHPDIPWKLMAGMRDKLAHDYFGVDLEILWKTVKEDIPKLKHLIRPLMKSKK
ncbi:MAG: DUF86 domain-containing protein [Verrucomicrobiae bacterium]|nr:DUF86 domain-containing protein [Verrucomicrobiae bacterium]